MVTFISKDSFQTDGLGPEWVSKPSAKHIGEIVDENGQLATSHTGRAWRILSKKVYHFTANQQGVRKFFAVLALIFSIGLAYFSKTVRDLWSKKSESTYIATPLDDSLFGLSFQGVFSQTLCYGKQLQFVDKAKEISLLDFRKAHPLEKKAAIRLFELDDAIASLDEADDSFFNKINNASEELLQSFSLFDLQTAHVSALRYAFMSDAKLESFTLGDLNNVLQATGEGLSNQQTTYLLKHLVEYLTKHPLTPIDTLPRDSNEWHLHSVIRFHHNQIQEYMDNLPEVAFHFLIQYQVDRLDIDQMSVAQLTRLFPHHTTIFTGATGRYAIEPIAEERFKRSSPERQLAILNKLPNLWPLLDMENMETAQVQAIYKKLPPAAAGLVPVECLSELDLQGATKNNFVGLVYGRGPRIPYDASTVARLQAFPSSSVQHVFDILDHNELGRLSSEQVKGLKFHDLNAEKVRSLFTFNRSCFKDLSGQQIVDLIDLEISLACERISEEQGEQLRTLELSDKHKEDLDFFFAWRG